MESKVVRLRFEIACIAGIVLACCLVAAGTAQAGDPFPFAWSAKQDGNQVIQAEYDWDQAAYDSCIATQPPYLCKQESCNELDIADEPVRAFRFLNGNSQWRVQMNYPRSPQNRRMIGPSLHEAIKENSPDQPAAERRYCGQDIVFVGNSGVYNWSGSGAKYCPQEFDDHEWLASPYYIPGENEATDGRVHVVNHQEFHGTTATAPSQCGDPYDTYCTTDLLSCWWGSLTYSRSTTELSKCSTSATSVAGTPTPNMLGICYEHGNSQVPPPEADQLVATIPYRYHPNWGNGARMGYSEHSNILRGEGALSNYYYVVAIVRGPLTDHLGQPGVQKEGLCVIRTTNIADPDSWTAWNGIDFGARPASGYSITDSPANHVCAPVAPAMQPFSLTYNRYLRKYMLLGHGAISSTSSDWGVLYRLSDDLLSWSEPQLLMEAPNIRDTENCHLDKIAYPVLLDPNDPAAAATGAENRNFDHPGRTTDLYYRVNTRDPVTCEAQKGRLARLPIRFEQRRAILKDNLVGDDYGYDAKQGTGDSMFTESTGPETDYDDDPGAPNKFGKARTAIDTGSRWSYGTLNANGLEDGDDFWYGSAFHLPSNFVTANTTVDLMRWESTGFHGGIRLMPSGTAADRFRLVRGGPVATYLGPAEGFDLPTGRWFWLEIHQKLGNTAGGGTLNEVYVDGRLVMTSTEANRGAGTTTDSSPIAKVKYGIVHNSSPAGADTTVLVDRSSITAAPLGAIGAPPTPQGIRQSFVMPTIVGFTANVVTTGNPTGYRFYQKVNGVWTKIGESASPSWITSVISCSVNEFRISAYRAGSPSSAEQESIASPPLTIDACPD